MNLIARTRIIILVLAGKTDGKLEPASCFLVEGWKVGREVPLRCADGLFAGMSPQGIISGEKRKSEAANDFQEQKINR